MPSGSTGEVQEKEREGEVSANIEDIKNMLDGLETEIDTIERFLQQVLAQEAEGKEKSDPSESICPLGGELRSISRRISGAVQQLRGVRKRIEV